MRDWETLTLRDVGRGIVRHRSFFVTIVTLLLIATFLPGEPGESDRSVSEAGVKEVVAAERASAPSPEAVDLEAENGDGGDGAVSGAELGDREDPSDAVEPSSNVDLAASPEVLSSPNCDRATDRIKFPTQYAPPCLPLWPEGADNGGATYQGVTEDEITVVMRECPSNPAREAALSAAGIGHDPDSVREMRAGFLDIYNTHYNTYGRVVKFVYYSSNCSDEEEDRADATEIALGLQPFAVLHYPDAGGVFAEVLAHHGVINVSLGASTQDHYLTQAPYRWARLPSPEKQLALVAEYVGKRLQGAPARWAGDASLRAEERTFGLIYPDVAGGFRPALEYFEKKLAEYGVSLTVSVGVAVDAARAQEQARNAIVKLKEAGVTSVIDYMEPITNVFLTQEATRQLYYPEWVMTGALLQDGNIFGRTYDQTQWSNAFGLSSLQSAQSIELYDDWHLYEWHHGKPRPDNSGAVSWQPVMDIFMLGIHLAGPNLTPDTFRDGLFHRYPPSGGAAEGLVLRNRWSFGKDLWEWADYTTVDDVKEVWWDPDATGPDELGNDGRGMYREVNRSRRYTIGELPTGEPRVFDPEDTATFYDDYPAQDAPGEYECRSYKWEYQAQTDGPCSG